MKDCEFCRS